MNVQTKIPPPLPSPTQTHTTLNTMVAWISQDKALELQEVMQCQLGSNAHVYLAELQEVTPQQEDIMNI